MNIDPDYHKALEAFYLAWEKAKTARPSDDAFTTLLKARDRIEAIRIKQRSHSRP